MVLFIDNANGTIPFIYSMICGFKPQAWPGGLVVYQFNTF